MAQSENKRRYNALESTKEKKRKYLNENRKTVYEKNNLRKKELRLWMLEYKKTLKCNRCPENHPYCLEFHHKDKNKEFSISKSCSAGRSIKVILIEIAKCEVLCANCHRKEHFNIELIS